MKRLTTLLAAAVLLGAFAMPTVTMANDDGHKQIVRSMKKTFEAARMAAKRLPTFKDGAVVQRHRAAPDDLDYNSFGYWLHAAPRPNARPAIGAWAAGPLEWSAPEVPLTGAAIYKGTAKGFYAKHQKSSPHAPLQNLRIEGTFTAAAHLKATFDPNMTFSGEPMIVGTIGRPVGENIPADRRYIDVDARYVRTDAPGPARSYGSLLSLGINLSAPLNSDGTWRSKTVWIRDHSNDSMPKSGGAWGGRLIAGDEFPASAIGEKAVGTFGAWMKEDNGNKTVFLGAFSTGPGEPHVIAGGDNVCSAITGTGICGSPEFIELVRRARGETD